MNRLLSTKLKEGVVSFALLWLRVASGILMIPHGYSKLVGYAERKDKFMSFIGLSGPVSLALVIFAEIFCALLLTTGLLTRFALIPLMVAMAVASFQANGGDIFGNGEKPFLFLIVFITLFITGPGKYSLDSKVLKK